MYGNRLVATSAHFPAIEIDVPRSLRGRGCGPGSKWRPRAKEESVEETIARLITVACALTAHDAAAHAPRPLFLSFLAERVGSAGGGGRRAWRNRRLGQ